MTTNTAHGSITDPNIHEPKGASTATAGQVYAADGAGSGTWGKLSSTSLGPTGNPFGGQLLHVRNQQGSGVPGGNIAASSWQTRVLNTVVTNEITSASLSSNQIILLAGTYMLQGSATWSRTSGGGSFNSAVSKFKLYNVTAGADLVVSQSSSVTYTTVSVTMMLNSNITGRFVLSGTSALELRQVWSWTGLLGTVTEGFASGDGTIEVYTDLLIWKTA